MPIDPPQAFPATPPGSGPIRVQVRDLTQIFNSIDPSPFQDRDLDAGAEQFIVSWARDLPTGEELELVVQIDHPTPLANPGAVVTQAVHAFFARRSATAKRELRTLLRRGRISLLIGLVFLSACVVAGDLAAPAVGRKEFGEILRQGLT